MSDLLIAFSGARRWRYSSPEIVLTLSDRSTSECQFSNFLYGLISGGNISRWVFHAMHEELAYPLIFEVSLPNQVK